MARTARIALTETNIDSIRDAITEQLKSIYPNIQVIKDFTSLNESKRRLISWLNPDEDSRISFSMFLTPGKKLPKGMTKLFIFSSGLNGEYEIRKAKFIEAFRKLHPTAEFSHGGGYGVAPPSFLIFVEDKI